MNHFEITTSTITPIIYVVKAFGGKYEDTWEIVMMATLDKDVAQKYIDNHDLRQQAWIEKGDAYYADIEAWSKDFMINNPTPQWVDGQANERYSLWSQRMEKTLKRYQGKLAQKMGLDILSDFTTTHDHVSYRIEEVRVL